MLSYHRSMGEGLAGSEAPVSVCSSGLPASSAPSSSITIAIDQPSDQSSRPPEEPDSGLQRSPRPRPPRAPQADCSPRLDDPDRWLVSAQLRNVKEKSIKIREPAFTLFVTTPNAHLTLSRTLDEIYRFDQSVSRRLLLPSILLLLRSPPPQSSPSLFSSLACGNPSGLEFHPPQNTIQSSYPILPLRSPSPGFFFTLSSIHLNSIQEDKRSESLSLLPLPILTTLYSTYVRTIVIGPS